VLSGTRCSEESLCALPYVRLSERRGSRQVEERLQDGRKKLDIGKSCVRFRELQDLPLEVIEQVVGETPPERFIEIYESGGGRPRSDPISKFVKSCFSNSTSRQTLKIILLRRPRVTSELSLGIKRILWSTPSSLRMTR
jgi:hypothetical protein